ncbi:MAG TPA: cyclic nucleotide-binding domain-containing protein [Blastocatellia bacterium]|nr:cyclic nucleotide-binding domain-containing protein [Blastocatellia bacterium]
MKIDKRVLAAHPFFEGLDEQFIQIIASLAASERFEDGEYLFREGETADVLYLIQHGHVALEVYSAERGVVTVETIGAGDALGWSWLIPPYNWRFDARAVGLTRAIAVDGERLRELCQKDSDLNREMLMRITQIIAHRLHATTLQLLGVAAQAPDDRQPRFQSA